MKTLLFLISLLLSLNVFACMCASNNKSLEQNFKEYGFVAHVKILKKSAPNIKDSNLIKNASSLNQYAKVTIDIIELYKGNPATIVLEWGVNTSCNMGINENAEWVLFGNYINTEFATVRYCSPWIKLKNKDGEIQQHYDASELRKLAGLPARLIPDGKATSYFANGSISSIEEYKDKKLQGEWKLYYSNGLLKESVKYINGVRHGKANYYNKHGQLLKEFLYDDGKIIHSVYWYDTSYAARKMRAFFSDAKVSSTSPLQIQKETEGFLNVLTKNRLSCVYFETGELKRENWYYNNVATSFSCEYYVSGKLKDEIYNSSVADLTLEKRWDESGKIISDKKWEKGKFLGDTVKK